MAQASVHQKEVGSELAWERELEHAWEQKSESRLGLDSVVELEKVLEQLSAQGSAVALGRVMAEVLVQKKEVGSELAWEGELEQAWERKLEQAWGRKSESRLGQHLVVV
jgi:hypothetical protein